MGLVPDNATTPTDAPAGAGPTTGSPMGHVTGDTATSSDTTDARWRYAAAVAVGHVCSLNPTADSPDQWRAADAVGRVSLPGFTVTSATGAPDLAGRGAAAVRRPTAWEHSLCQSADRRRHGHLWHRRLLGGWPDDPAATVEENQTVGLGRGGGGRGGHCRRGDLRVQPAEFATCSAAANSNQHIEHAHHIELAHPIKFAHPIKHVAGGRQRRDQFGPGR